MRIDEIIFAAEPPKRPSVFLDLKHFLTVDCELKSRPYGRGREGLFEPWLDWTEGSACRRRWEFFMKPLPKGKWGRLLLEPRGAGKSMSAKCLSFGHIIDDPETTISYNCQNKAMAPRSVRWVGDHIRRKYPDLVNKLDWSASQFTVHRRAGIGDNPTMIAGSPESDVTGSRPNKVWLDDIVCLVNNVSPRERQRVLDWWISLQDQFSSATEVGAIGTTYDHHNLWKEIEDHYASYFEILKIDCYDDDMGNVYPWMDDDYLKRQEEKDPRAFRMQFRNQRMPAEGAIFSEYKIIAGDPPTVPDLHIEGGERLADHLNVYMLTDTAQSDTGKKHTSETALIVIAKDYGEITYVVDIDIGRWNPSGVVKHFLAMYGKWLPHGLMYATLEDRGPSKDYYSLIPDIARLTPEIEFRPALMVIPRGSREAKDSRIGLLNKPFSDGRIKFSTRWIRPEMFRWNPRRGEADGVATQRILSYSATGDSPKDFMDALADLQAVQGKGHEKGPACPGPINSAHAKIVLTDADWARRRALGQLNRVTIL
jgi:hypothetical protein